MNKVLFVVFISLLAFDVWANKLEIAIDALNKHNYIEALPLFKSLAEQGDPQARFYLGSLYANGQGFLVNQQMAAKWYQLAAEQGHSKSQYNLGVMFENGIGVVKNDNEAIKWWRLAAEQGNVNAQYNLGNIYFIGKFVKRNFSEAIKWFRIAAEQGDSRAQYSLCAMYKRGEGVSQSHRKAFKWCRLAAESGMPEAQYSLGIMYGNGEGVSTDHEKEFKWHRLAAEQGGVNARSNLGVLYYKGEGVPQDIIKAVNWWRLAAEQGDSLAQFNLGNFYRNGEGIAQDFSEAKKWFLLAAEQGIFEAQFNIGIMYDNGEGVPQDYKQAINWYQLAAEQGYAKAQYNLGVMYDNGEGVLQDYKQAIKWYRLAADQGHSKSQYNLGLRYRDGKGVAQDYKQAIKWYRLAAEQGNAEAQYNLGNMYVDGNGVAKNEKEAVKWFRLAAEKDIAQASFYLAVSYELGRGVSKNEKEAFKWYLKSAEQGIPEAQFNIGLRYANGKGKGITRNSNEAIKWYLKSAEQGNSSAQYNLGNMYVDGNGVAKNEKEAVKWFRLASEQGDSSAQYNLANHYLNGKGIAQDYNQAIKWYRLAAEQGYSSAQYNLGYMYYIGQGVILDKEQAANWFVLAARQGVVEAQNYLDLIHKNKKDVLVSSSMSDVVGNSKSKQDQGDVIVDPNAVQAHSSIADANTIEIKANSYISKGKNREALEQFKLAIDIKKKKLGDDNAEVYGLLINIAEMYFSLNDHAKAKEILMDVAYKTKDKHSELYALAIQHLAKNALTSGNYKLALTYLKEAVDILEDGNEKNADQLASVLISYGDINLSMRKLNNALEVFERAQAIITKKYGSADIYNAIILIEISKTLRSLGQYESAVLKAELAIDILSKSPKATEQQMINAKNVLAINLVSLGQLSKAKDILLKAGTNSNQLDHQNIDAINAAMNLGDIYLASGEYLAASIKYKGAFESIDMTKFYGMPKVPEILAKYAGSEYLKGDNAEAKRLGYESLSYSLATMDDHISLITPLSWLAVIQHKDSPNTGIFILKYVVNLLQLSKENVAQLGSYSFLTYSKSIKDSYHLLAKWLIDVGRIDEARLVLKLSKENDYFQFIGRSVDPNQIKSIISYTPSETKLLEQFLKITNKIKQQRIKEFLLKEKSDNGLSKDETNLLVAIKNQIEENKKLLNVAFEKKLQVESNYLKPNNYVMGKDVLQLQYALSEDLLTVFVTGQNISIERHWKLDKKILHQKVDDFIKVTHSPKSNPKPVAQELYKLIFEPIADEINKLGAKTIVLILEDVLRYVPFGALYDGSQYLEFAQKQ
jgi:TPR repeat protein